MFAHQGLEDGKGLCAGAVACIDVIYRVIQYLLCKALDFASAACHEVEWWQSYQMKPTNHSFDWYALERSGNRIYHVKNSVVGAPGENDEFVVFLDGHDDFMSEIIRCQLTILPYEKAFISGRREIGTGYVRKNEDVWEYLIGCTDSLKSFGVVCQERFFETDVFLDEGQESNKTISAGGFAKIYLGVSICVKKAPETSSVIEMMVGQDRSINGRHINRQVFCVLCE